MSASLFASFISLILSIISLYFVITVRDLNAQTKLVKLQNTLSLLQEDVDQTQSQVPVTDGSLAGLIIKNQTYNLCLSNTSNTCSQLTTNIQLAQGNLTSVKTIENINNLYLITNASCINGINELQTRIAMVSANSNNTQLVQEGTFTVSLDDLYNTTSTYRIQKLVMNEFELVYTIYQPGWTLMGLPIYSPVNLKFRDFIPPLSVSMCSASLWKRALIEFQSNGFTQDGLFIGAEMFCEQLVFYANGASLSGTSLGQDQDLIFL